MQYDAYNCGQLAEEAQRISARVKIVLQNTARAHHQSHGVAPLTSGILSLPMKSLTALWSGRFGRFPNRLIYELRPTKWLCGFMTFYWPSLISAVSSFGNTLAVEAH